MNNNLSDTKHQRPVRSYVLRQGRMTTRQEKALQNLWLEYGIDISEKFLDLAVLFQRAAPCVLEIGFGMAHSFITQATTHPEQNFIGIEVHRPGVGNALALIAQEQLSNVKIFCADAVTVLQQCIPDHTLNKVQIFFPDPWPKKRHHKRRLIQPDFIKLIAQKLISGGVLHIATDWQDYAEHILNVLSQSSSFINQAANGKYISRPDDRPLTKFEQRGQKLGHGVWDIIFKLA